MKIIGYLFLFAVVIVYILCCVLVARAVLPELFSVYPELLKKEKKKERARIVILTLLCLIFFPITIPVITILQRTRQKRVNKNVS